MTLQANTNSSTTVVYQALKMNFQVNIANLGTTVQKALTLQCCFGERDKTLSDCLGSKWTKISPFQDQNTELYVKKKLGGTFEKKHRKYYTYELF